MQVLKQQKLNHYLRHKKNIFRGHIKLKTLGVSNVNMWPSLSPQSRGNILIIKTSLKH